MVIFSFLRLAIRNNVDKIEKGLRKFKALKEELLKSTIT
jgi:hypothetical protein